jgi:hypothetical protein
MPALENPKYEAFAQDVALNVPAAQAYRAHVAKDPNGSALSIDPKASKLAGDSKVKARIEELRGKVAAAADKKFDLTKEKWLNRLVTIADKAENAEDFSAAQNALDKVGKASAWYAPEEVNVMVGYEPPKKAMERLLGKGVDLASILKLAGVTTA